MLLRCRAVPRERAAWLLLGAAILCWAAGEAYWTALIVDDPQTPYPSGADAALRCRPSRPPASRRRTSPNRRPRPS